MSRRTRTSSSGGGAKTNNKKTDDDDNNNNNEVEDSLEWCVLAPGTSECYFGIGGDSSPSFSVANPWSSLDVLPEALFASNAPFVMRKFGEHLNKNRPIVVCVPVTASDVTKFRICKSFFETVARCSAVCLVSEPVACSFACGQTTGVTVIDLGWSHATAAFVEQGRSTKFVSSSSLGLKKFFANNSKDNNNVSSQPQQHQQPLSEEQFNLQCPNKNDISNWYLTSSSHLESMCQKLPLKALQQFPVLLVGGGGGCDGLGSGLSKLIRKVVIAKKKKYDDDEDESESASSNDDRESNDDDDDDDKEIKKKSSKKDNKNHNNNNNNNNNNDKNPDKYKNVQISNVIRVPASASRLFAFRGASLLAASGVLDDMYNASVSMAAIHKSNRSISSISNVSSSTNAIFSQLGCVISREEFEIVLTKSNEKNFWNQYQQQPLRQHHDNDGENNTEGGRNDSAGNNSEQLMGDFVSWRFPK